MILPKVLESRLASLLKWGLYLLLPLPLYISSTMLFPFITGRNFAFRIIVEILVAIWAGLLVISAEYRPRLTFAVKAVLVFLLVVILADLLGINVYRSIWSNYERMEGLLALVHMTAFFLLAVSVFRKFSDWKWYAYGSIVVSGVVALVALSQKFGLTRSYQGGIRVDGTIGNPAYLASYLMFHVFFILFFLYRERIAWIRWALSAIAVFELFIIYLTATRGVILAMIAAAFFLAVGFALRRPVENRERILRRLAIGVLVFVLLGAGLFMAFRDNEYVKSHPVLARFASISFTERTVQSRFLIWDIAWQGVKERPILGWGQENFYFIFNKYFNPSLWANEPWFDRSHNVFFDWLVHAGILGLFSYLSVLALTVWNIWRAFRTKSISFYEGGILAGLLGAYFFQNLFVFDNFQSYFLLFFTIGFADHLAHAASSPTGQKNDASAARPRALTEKALAVLAAAGICVLVLMYFLNIRPMLASREIIQGMFEASRQALPNAIRARFEKAISYNTFGSGEAREQLASLSRSIIEGQGNKAPNEVSSFIDFSVREMKIPASHSSPDAKHLLFLASIENNASIFGISHAEAALDALKRAIALAPKKQQIYFELGTTYLILGDGKNAVETMRKAVALDPSFPGASLNLALAGFAARDRDTAEEAVGSYRALVPNPDTVVLSRLIQGYLRFSDYKSIKLLLEEAINKEPDSAAFYGQYAAVLLQLGDREGAKTAARKAGELNPSLKPESEKFINDINAGRTPQ